jgi:hypothetical protein
MLLSACGKSEAPAGPTGAPESEPPEAEQTTPGITHVVEPPEATEAVTEPVTLVPWDDTVEHLFFHTVITYPEQAFDGDSEEWGFDEYMVTLDEYNRILQSLYDKHYIIVDMNDVWSEYTTDGGAQRMKRNTLMIPEGKIPIILSYDDLCYYPYMLGNGFTYRLILGPDGEIWSYGLDPEGNSVISQDLDTITVLDKFIKEHPDFSLNGAKGCLCLTGYEGILGYRTNTITGAMTEAFEENRLREVARVKPIVEKLKETGWYFASHSWGHIRFETKSLGTVKADAERWQHDVGDIVGPTKLLVYPHGSRLDAGDFTKTGEAFKYYQSLGFRIFASVGNESFSYIKPDICAVICDRMHADGHTLRAERDRYLKFYDAKEVWDSARPTGKAPTGVDYVKTW